MPPFTSSRRPIVRAERFAQARDFRGAVREPAERFGVAGERTARVRAHGLSDGHQLAELAVRCRRPLGSPSQRAPAATTNTAARTIASGGSSFGQGLDLIIFG